MAIPPAAALWKASTYDAGNDRLTDLTGNGLHARLGSAVGADGNDPLRLVYDGAKYLYLPGLTGNYISTPDSAAVSVTGNIDIRVRAALTDWTPGAATALVGKWLTSGNQKSYYFRVETSGVLTLFISTSGSDQPSVASSVATGVTDGSTKWVRVTRVQSSGLTKFWTSDDGVSWSQLGIDRTLSAGSAIFDGTGTLQFGALEGAFDFAAGKFHWCQIRNNVLDDGTGIVFDTDFSTAAEPYATFIAGTGQTVTINRSAAGRKAAIVDATLLLLGTDDYLEVADNALLDFAAADSFTIALAYRYYGSSTGQILMAKKTGTGAEVGYLLRRATTTGDFLIGDGTFGPSVTRTITAGVATLLSGARRVATDDIEAYRNGEASGSPTADSTLLTLANSNVLRFGRFPGAGTSYADMEFFGAGVWPQALTASELAEVATDFGIPFKRAVSHRRLSQAVKRASMI